MQWSDRGYVIALRRHGESALIAELLTREHGRHLGLVRGGQSPKLRAILQPGNEVAAVWRGRLSAHLGTFACELVRAHAARLIDDPARLAALSAAAALVVATLPEREPHADVFASFAALLTMHSIRAATGLHIMSAGNAACSRLWALASISHAAPQPGPRSNSPMSRRVRAARCPARRAGPIMISCCNCRSSYGETRAPTRRRSSPACA